MTDFEFLDGGEEDTGSEDVLSAGRPHRKHWQHRQRRWLSLLPVLGLAAAGLVWLVHDTSATPTASPPSVPSAPSAPRTSPSRQPPTAGASSRGGLFLYFCSTPACHQRAAVREIRAAFAADLPSARLVVARDVRHAAAPLASSATAERRAVARLGKATVTVRVVRTVGVREQQVATSTWRPSHGGVTISIAQRDYTVTVDWNGPPGMPIPYSRLGRLAYDSRLVLQL